MTADTNHSSLDPNFISSAIREVAQQNKFRVTGHAQIKLFAEFDDDQIYLECCIQGSGLKLERHRFVPPERYLGKIVSLQWVLDFMRFRKQKFDEAAEMQRIARERENQKIISENERVTSPEIDERDEEIANLLGYSPQSSLAMRLRNNSPVTSSHDTSSDSWEDDWMQEEWETHILGPDVEDGVWKNN